MTEHIDNSNKTILAVVLRLGRSEFSEGLASALVELMGAEPGTEVVVAENADGSPIPAPTASDVASSGRFPHRVVRFEHNIGYAAAINTAVRSASQTPDYVVVLTDDVVVADGNLARLVEHCTDPAVAVVAPLIRTDGQIRAGGTWNARWGWAKHGIIASASIPKTPFDTTWGDGACLAINGHFFAAIGGFDERTFLYGEDLILCLQAHRRGLRVLIEPGTIVEQASGMYRRSGAHGYLLIRNEMLAVRTNGSPLWISATTGAARAGLEVVRVLARSARRHHARQAIGMGWGVIDGLRGRFGPPPRTLARWAAIPAVDRSSIR